ncbi:hypothetical protein EGW08_011212 [Elysia chlorotica]|uniref:Peptidase A2 domain-containing protein n=1 Tax=Elysia chlorotica TaxID=188477 RepID=A0A433THB4_ELYCH|nr:hypothetical protein EGW08_011212 [Elysia chlorotica]
MNGIADDLIAITKIEEGTSTYDDLVCHSALLREVQLPEIEEADFLGGVQHVRKVATWTAVLHIDGTPEDFKLDTGAAVSVVGEKIAIGKDLQPSDKVLKGPGDTPLHVIVLFQAFLKYKDREIQEPLYVAGITLNEKCEFSQPTIQFLGHIIDDQGIRADPQKVQAIQKLPTPTNITELQCLLGIVPHSMADPKQCTTP